MTSLIPDYIRALKLELSDRRDYLENESVDTIYLGGGTPSLLEVRSVQELLEHLFKLYPVSGDAEITLEANPDDLDNSYLHDLSTTAVNRLSIGVQSFNDSYLAMLNRRHDSRRATECIIDARKKGFKNISIDLIYGLPGMTAEEWNFSLSRVPEVEHVSAYHLTIEPGTAFARKAAAGLLSIPSEDDSTLQFFMLDQFARERNLIHYEISNLGKEGLFSRHNMAYWQRKKYLGVGPSAHSYDQKSRQWNIRDVRKYMSSLNDHTAFCEKEVLTEADRFNEYIMVSLRTMWGADCSLISGEFGNDCRFEFESAASSFLTSDHMLHNNGIYKMSPSGWLISDHILSTLMRDK